jgi:hypothetical protein
MRRIWEEATTCVAASYLYRDEPRQCIATYRELLESARPGVDRVKSWASTGIAAAGVRLGQLDLAREAADNCLSLSPDKLEPSDGVLIQAVVALVALHSGDHAEARTRGDEAMVLVAKTPAYVTELTTAVMFLMEVYVELWREHRQPELAAAARQTCKQARSMARRVPFVRPQASYWVGECEWIEGKPASARRWWEQAIVEAKALDLQYQMGRAHLALARLKGLDAPGHVETAHRIFERIDLPRPRSFATVSASPERWADT